MIGRVGAQADAGIDGRGVGGRGIDGRSVDGRSVGGRGGFGGSGVVVFGVRGGGHGLLRLTMLRIESLSC